MIHANPQTKNITPKILGKGGDVTDDGIKMSFTPKIIVFYYIILEAICRIVLQCTYE